MRTFLLIFLGTWSGMNLFAWWGVQRGWGWGHKHRWWLLAAFAAMTYTPIFARKLDHVGHVWLARTGAWLGFTWMAVVFWLFMIFATLLIWNVVWRLAALGLPRLEKLVVSPQRTLLAAAIFVAVALVWGAIEAQIVHTHRLTLASDRLPPGSAPLRIALIGDMHLGPYVETSRWDRVVRRVAALQPDIVLCVGDLVDGRSGHQGAPPKLAAVSAPLGKYSVLGNHEFYGELPEHLAFHEACGFTVLRGAHARVDDRLVIAGVDDPAVEYTGGGTATLDEDAALPPADAPGFRLFLKHEPTVRPASRGRFDLQVSGHGHGGQIWPFHLFVWLRYRNLHGAYRLPEGSMLYVTRGTGTWGPPLRILAPPEILLIEIRPNV